VTSSPFTAVYDACVLYPASLRDFLMWLGLSGRFRARWSAQIHDEWKRNLLINRPDLSADQLDRTSDLMDRAIPRRCARCFRDGGATPGCLCREPLRSRPGLRGRPAIFSLSIVFSIAIIGLGMSGHLGWFGARTSLTEDFMVQFTDHKLRTSCDDGTDPNVGEVPFCRLGMSGMSKPVVAVFGDSHSDALNPVFDKLGKDLGFSYVHNGLGGCLPLLGIDVVKGNWNRGVCESLADKQFNFVKENNIKTVF